MSNFYSQSEMIESIQTRLHPYFVFNHCSICSSEGKNRGASLLNLLQALTLHRMSTFCVRQRQRQHCSSQPKSNFQALLRKAKDKLPPSKMSSTIGDSGKAIALQQVRNSPWTRSLWPYSNFHQS